MSAPQLIEGVSPLEEVQDLCRLLEFLAEEVAAQRNFELVQGPAAAHAAGAPALHVLLDRGLAACLGL